MNLEEIKQVMPDEQITTEDPKYEKRTLLKITKEIIKQFIVATLNVASSNISPFEFHKNPLVKKCSDVFLTFVKKLAESSKKMYESIYKNVSEVDRFLNSKRFSLLYNKLAAKFVTNQSLTFENFREEWFACYDKLLVDDTKLLKTLHEKSKVVAKDGNVDLKKFSAILDDVCLFDWAAVLTFREFPEALEEHSKQIQAALPRLIVEYCDKNDINALFLQELNDDLCARLAQVSGKYKLFTNKDQNTGILIPLKYASNYRVFDGMKDFVSKTEVHKELLILQDVVNGTYLVCAHLSAKSRANTITAENKEGNPKNYDDQFKALLIYLKSLGEVILGIDANHFPEELESYNILNRVIPLPNTSKVITTDKCRTYMQPQLDKADKPVRAAKDLILIINAKQDFEDALVFVQQLSGSDLASLPNQDHPCDHYAVIAKIRY